MGLMRPDTKRVSDEKKEMVENLYLSGLPEEFIAMQMDLDVPTVVAILEEFEMKREAPWRSMASG